MNFKNFLLFCENLSDFEIANMYFNGTESVRSLSKKTKKSLKELYKIINFYGKANRRNPSKRNSAISLLSSGLDKEQIARITGYSLRHIRNLDKE